MHFQCAPKYLTIENNVLSFNEYYLLTKAKSVQYLKLCFVKIIVADGTLAQLENIMETLPNVTDIEMGIENNYPPPNHFGPLLQHNNIERTRYPVAISLQTFEKLLTLKQNMKIKYLKLCVSAIFDPLSCCQFLAKNMDPSGSHYFLNFDYPLFQNTQFMRECATIFADHNDLFVGTKINGFPGKTLPHQYSNGLNPLLYLPMQHLPPVAVHQQMQMLP